MFKQAFFKNLCVFFTLNNCYAPYDSDRMFIPKTQVPHLNEIPNYNNNGGNQVSYYDSSIHTDPLYINNEGQEQHSPFEIIEPLGVIHQGINNQSELYSREDILNNDNSRIKKYVFECAKALNEESLSDIVTLLQKLNFSIFEGFDDTLLIDQCFQKISKLDKCHIQIACGVLLLYLNNLKIVRNETISFFAIDYYNCFIKHTDKIMSDFYQNFKKFIDSRAFDRSNRLVGNHLFLDDSFKSDLANLLFNYKMLFEGISSSSLFNFSYKECCFHCDQPFSNNDLNHCECPMNEQKSGFHYNKNERILCEYFISNEKFVNIPLQNRAYKFLGYGFDVFGDVFIAAAEERFYGFIPVGRVTPGCKIIVYNNKLFFVNNELDYFAYRAVHNLESRNTSEKLVDYNLFSNFLKHLAPNNLILVFMVCAPLIAIIFFVLFCVNWSGHCHNCGNHAVKFLGGFFNFFVGIEFALLASEFMLNFKNCNTLDSVVRYAASIKNGFCTIRKIIRSKMAGNLTFNNFFVILGSVVAGLLAVWPLIWFIVIEALGKRLVNGVSFIAGLSLLISGFGFGSIAYYYNRYKEVKNILEYDRLN